MHAREQLRRIAIGDLDELLSTVKDAETGQRGFLLTADRSYLKPYDDAIAKLPSTKEKLKSLREIGVTEADIQSIRDLTDRKLAELHNSIDVRNNLNLEAARALVEQGEGRRIMDELRAVVTRVRAEQIASVRFEAKLSDTMTRARTLVFILTGILNVGFLAWAYRRITESIRERDIAFDQLQKRRGELQQQKDLLGVTLGSIGDCVIVTDEKGRITFMNPIAEKTTGWTLEEAQERPANEVFHIINEHTRDRVESPVAKVIEHGVIVGLANHTLLVRKDGTEIPIDDSGAPIRDTEGNNRGVVLVFRDFSEHKANERALREAKQAAESANKTKDQFLAMLSHELRTPLTPVLATLNLWEASEEVPQSMREDVQMLRRSIELEARIIDDLLDLTRVARGLLSFSPENTDVHALIEFIVGLSQSEFLAKNLGVVLQLKAARHHVQTDAARLQQVLWNILRNAIKFTDHGAITITTSNVGDNKISIAITDTGIGMTPDTISRLFIPFEQADPAQSRRYGGLGLGMAISNALVELLEGKIQAESKGLGHGSAFTVTFTTVEPSTAASEPPPASKIPPEKLKLLLVEDHADTARALQRLMQSRGFNISTAGSVATALETLQQDKFDVLLCDLGLPDGTGLDLIRKVRETSRTLPAIALTGFGMQQDVERAAEAGFDAHLTKPVNIQTLEATIWRLTQDR